MFIGTNDDCDDEVKFWFMIRLMWAVAVDGVSKVGIRSKFCMKHAKVNVSTTT